MTLYVSQIRMEESLLESKKVPESHAAHRVKMMSRNVGRYESDLAEESASARSRTTMHQRAWFLQLPSCRVKSVELMVSGVDEEQMRCSSSELAAGN